MEIICETIPFGSLVNVIDNIARCTTFTLNHKNNFQKYKCLVWIVTQWGGVHLCHPTGYGYAISMLQVPGLVVWYNAHISRPSSIGPRDVAFNLSFCMFLLVWHTCSTTFIYVVFQFGLKKIYRCKFLCHMKSLSIKIMSCIRFVTYLNIPIPVQFLFTSSLAYAKTAFIQQFSMRFWTFLEDFIVSNLEVLKKMLKVTKITKFVYNKYCKCTYTLYFI